MQSALVFESFVISRLDGRVLSPQDLKTLGLDGLKLPQCEDTEPLYEKCELLREQYDSLSDLYDELVKQNGRETTHALDVFDKLQTENKELQDELDDLRSEIEDLKTENSKLKNEKLQSEIEDLRKENSLLNDEKSRLRKTLYDETQTPEKAPTQAPAQAPEQRRKSWFLRS